MKHVTIMFLRREGELLLAMKKRGFGQGKWNGAGGKAEPGETPLQAAIRETEEEIGVTPIEPRKVAARIRRNAPAVVPAGQHPLQSHVGRRYRLAAGRPCRTPLYG
jgi:8-oxo-dGTP pyrophosphatase MutT (NUDIX family)